MREPLKMMVFSPNDEIWRLDWDASKNKENTRRWFKHKLDYIEVDSLLPVEYLKIVLIKQDIVLSEYLHVLHFILKYSPLMVAESGEDFTKGYIIMQDKRKTKVFSLKTGEFCGTNVFASEKNYSIMSANYPTYKEKANTGPSLEAMQILDAARQAWEGKLIIIDTFWNTIREAPSTGKPLLATYDDMRMEAAYRLRSMGLLNKSETFLQYGLHGSEQYAINGHYIDAKGELSIIDGEVKRFFDLGYSTGVFYGRENTINGHATHRSNFIGGVTEPILLQQGKIIWALGSYYASDETMAQIKVIEKEHDIFVYYIQNHIEELSLFYIDRKMDKWAKARRDLEKGEPVIYLDSPYHNPYFDKTHFGNINIKPFGDKGGKYVKEIFRVPDSTGCWFSPVKEEAQE